MTEVFCTAREATAALLLHSMLLYQCFADHATADCSWLASDTLPVQSVLSCIPVKQAHSSVDHLPIVTCHQVECQPPPDSRPHAPPPPTRPPPRPPRNQKGNTNILTNDRNKLLHCRVSPQLASVYPDLQPYQYPHLPIPQHPQPSSQNSVLPPPIPGRC